MTNEQAIIELRDLISDKNTDRENEALVLAIEKLRDKRPTLRHVIINRSQYGICDGCYDEARHLVYCSPITKEFIDSIGWKIEENNDD